MTRYIAPIIFLLLSVSLALSYIDPTYTEILKALERERELAGYIADAQTAQTKLDNLKEQYAAFPAGADDALHVLIPDSIDPTRLIVDMDAVIGKLGLTMKSPGVAVESGVDESSLTTYRVDFSVNASYPVFRTFLHDLEASLALRDMGSITFHTAGVGSNEFNGPSALHDYSLSITTYSLQP